VSVLVDTSVWIDHFRNANAELVALLGRDRVLVHPLVLLEIACGTPPAPRARTMADLSALRSCKPARQEEIADFIEREKLYGLVCGVVDISLLASTLLTPGASLWTLDKPLSALATRFGIAHRAQ